MNPQETPLPQQPSAPPQPSPAQSPAQAPAPAPDPKTKVPDTLPVAQPGERTFTVIRRHPVGMVGIYGMCGLVLLVTAALAFGVAPSMATDGGNQVIFAGILVFAVVLGVCAVVAFVAGKIYRGNTWTVTTDSLTQVRQTSLFKRESSQLSLGNIEDVTSEQNGVLARMLHYGVLRVEIAGDSNKFVFPFCPNPNYYAQQVLMVKEAFERNRQAEERPAQQSAAPVPPAPPPVEPPVIPPEPPRPPAGPATTGY